jgi:hypothetical protein
MTCRIHVFLISLLELVMSWTGQIPVNTDNQTEVTRGNLFHVHGAEGS